MHPDLPERSPQTPNEWGILIVLSFFFGLFLLIELASEFSVQKLSVPFFLFSWVVLLVLHEGGHALMARLFGWRVERICLGTGRIRWERPFFGIPVEFRTIPLSGFVVPRPVDLRAARLKLSLIYAAGPGIELLAVALIAAIVGPDRLLQASNEVPMIAIQSFSVAAIFGAGLNLLPLPHRTQQGMGWSDGLGMVASWWLRDEDLQRLRDSSNA